MSDNKRIAKNTIILYFRMIFIMGVSLYTSRVILDKLGVNDYSLYSVVGSVVGMLSFITGTLSIGSSRFITYELGRNDIKQLSITFNTAFYAHLLLALFVVIFLETIGLWYVFNKMVVADDRFFAALIAYQLSIISSIITILIIPYTALIMAHERMELYAYISIFEALSKLIVAYLISICQYDRLMFYAFMLTIVNLSVALLYYLYCHKNYIESRLRKYFDKSIFRSMIGFSSWNILATLSETLSLQGIVVLLNLFFAPYVVASQTIANQVSGTIMKFVNNFRTAINPQIIKNYASGDRADSKKLALETTVYCFDMVLMLGLPCIVLMDKLMNIWLVEVPPYAVVFTQLIIVRQIINTFNASFYTPMIAANKLKTNSIAAVFSGIVTFLLLYILFRNGFGPMWIQYVGILSALFLSLLIKPYVLYKDIGYTKEELLKCFKTCAIVAIISCLISFPAIFLLGDTLFESIIKGFISFVAVVISSFVMMERTTREKLLKYLTTKIRGIIS